MTNTFDNKMEEADKKKIADKAIINIEKFIDVEKKFVSKEHKLTDRIEDLFSIFNHALELIPEDMDPEHDTNQFIWQKLNSLKALAESERLRDLSIEKEEELVLNQIKNDISNRDWRLVKNDIDTQSEQENRILRLEAEEIEEIHQHFKDLVHMIRQNKLITTLDSDKKDHKSQV